MFRSVKLGRQATDPHRYAAVPMIQKHADMDALALLIPDAANYRKRMASPGGMLGNDKYGCCTCAAIGHLLQLVCANQGIASPVTKSMVLQWYQEACGWNPDDPSTDNGGNMLDVLQYLQRIGVVTTFGRIDLSRREHVATAINLFCGLYVGAGLPTAWQSTDRWTAGPDKTGIWAPYSWGGHAFNLATYNSQTDSYADTWDSWVELFADGRDGYVDEGYGVVFPQSLHDGKSLQGLDIDGLNQELKQIA